MKLRFLYKVIKCFIQKMVWKWSENWNKYFADFIYISRQTFRLLEAKINILNPVTEFWYGDSKLQKNK